MYTHPRMLAQFFPRQKAGHFLLGSSTSTIGVNHQALDSGMIEGSGQDIGRTRIEASRNLLVFQRDRVPALWITRWLRRGLDRRIQASGAQDGDRNQEVGTVLDLDIVRDAREKRQPCGFVRM